MKIRYLIVAGCCFFLFSLLIVQYFKIQIIEGDKWTRLASSQHECIVEEPGERGIFFATILQKGHPERVEPLAIDVAKFHLYIDPLSIPKEDHGPIYEKLIEILKISDNDKKNFIDEFGKKSRSRRLQPWIDRGVKQEILAWWKPFSKKRKIPLNALYFTTDYLRSYPCGKLLGQVLHTIRELKDEKTKEGIPTGGLEAYFNDIIKGSSGKRKHLRSPLNPLEIDEIVTSAKKGADVYLTINHYIQAIAEEEIQKGVRLAQAKGGWAVMMDPFTGEILALAQYPFFEPSKYKSYFNDPTLLEHSKVKAITDPFEVGSIMKPITVAIALKANEELKKRGEPPIFNPREMMRTTRSIFPGRAKKPLIDNPTHPYLNISLALQKSSNVYVAELVDRIIQRLGPEWYRNELINTFGFGQKTKIELPGETGGHVPEKGKKFNSGAPEWSLSTPYSLAMGYSILATSLQMLRAHAVLVTGKFIQPTLVRKIVRESDGQREILLDNTQEKKFPEKISPQAAREVYLAMKYTTKTGGTAILAEIPGYTEGGKTGTAEKIVNGTYSKRDHISSFIGFVPASENQKPAFLLIVSIDEPKYKVTEDGVRHHMGGRCAAPVFREIARRTLEYMGIEPDDPFGYPPGDPRHHPDKADWAKEVRALKGLYEEYRVKK